MKGLCNKLASILPVSLKIQTQVDLFDQSAAYIEQLTNRISQLKGKKGETSTFRNPNNNNVEDDSTMINSDGVRLPILKINESDTGLQVNLIGRSKRKLVFYEVIRIIEEGGAEVVHAGYTTIDQKVYYTLHAQAKISRVGIEITSIRERLQALADRNL
ncbi:hypothetical protein OSB04_004755 [Centaurea solstitialis]|uniref:BHLH domain-containing protein n=1 Tax=Centaurea solstitialis TaxID=347529 RepID=A0AA38WP33_9ASTR|nr:hypothetical protein OSB04_004755 [Centaurea solstitialis]